MPVRLPQPEPLPPSPGYVAIDRSLGDPMNILAWSSRPSPVREALTVPPGNQMGQLPPQALEDRLGSGTGAAGRNTGAGGSGAESHTGAGGSGPGATATGGADAAPGRTGAGGEASGAGPALPRPALRMMHPSSAVFDVVVVQSAPIEALPESSGALSGHPVYSVFLRVGGPKEWILQYCVPGEDNQNSAVNAGVVRLGMPSPVAAPYPQVTYLPPVRPRPGAYIMIHGFLDANGRFEDLQVLRSEDLQEGKLVLPVLDQWEFRPAVRDGRPVRVEILLAIPRA